MKILKKYYNSHFSIHYSFFIIGLIFFIIGQFDIFILYFFFLCLHEFVHFYFAKKLGYKMQKVRLFAYGAVLYGELDAFSDNDEIIIALSAPLFNLVVCFIVVAFWWVFPESYYYTMDICSVNLAIFIFNALPFFPLDGGRALLGSLSKKFGRYNSLKVLKLLTLVFSLVLFLCFCLSIFFSFNPSFLFVSLSLFLSVFYEDKNSKYEQCLSSFSKNLNKPLLVKIFALSSTCTLAHMHRKTSKRYFSIFKIISQNESKEISEIELEKYILKYPLFTKLEEIIF